MPISPSALIGEILSYVNDYHIEDMVTFTALVKIYSLNILQYKGSAKFLSMKFSHAWQSDSSIAYPLHLGLVS